jgi:hypothetical protein
LLEREKVTGLIAVVLHDEMGSGPAPVDLDAPFRDLGVALKGPGVVFDETAPPLASIGSAITRSSPNLGGR